MKNIYAKRTSDTVLQANITSTNLLPDGCERHLDDGNYQVLDDDGIYNYKVVGGVVQERTPEEKGVDNLVKIKLAFREKLEKKITDNIARINLRTSRTDAQIKTQYDNLVIASQGWTTLQDALDAWDAAMTWLGLK